ncbi:YeeE/YedE thiosulfate transporter family protein [Candidatus Pelagibacter sp.]|nr:YeeE/YedE thiosulfate transporter family protein [Candidatus Pelagibacter sp.]
MVIINFTPLSAFTGGLLIGFAAFLFFVFNGRMAGVSSIASDSVLKDHNRYDNLLFLMGLIIGPILYLFSGNEIESIITNSLPLLILGGLLVGVGTKIGNGCTSGHGVCGISRFSIRSITATIVFILTGIFTVLIFGVQ